MFILSHCDIFKQGSYSFRYGTIMVCPVDDWWQYPTEAINLVCFCGLILYKKYIETICKKRHRVCVSFIQSYCPALSAASIKQRPDKHLIFILVTLWHLETRFTFRYGTIVSPLEDSWQYSTRAINLVYFCGAHTLHEIRTNYLQITPWSPCFL